ncbi:MAG: legume lectin beta domain protein [Actinomycetia bacterium]|nr:legume lectin beta domain protein [Actinomycetes bacterium]
MRFVVRSRTTRVLLAAALALVMVRPAAGDVTTVSRDTLRTAWDSGEPNLSPSSVVSSDFGQQFATRLDGQVYAQPLVVGGTLIVATENNKIYGLSPVDGAIKWSRTLGKLWPASAIGCGDLVPNFGVTSAPVYDPATGTVYITSKTNDGPDSKHPHWYMHAVNPSTGAERSGWPVTIAGSPSNDKSTPFNPMHQLQRAGLLLLDGVVYAGFGSHCDFHPYRGYVAGVSTTTHKLTTLWAAEVGSANQGAGIWAGGGGIMSDGAGRAFVATGNGVGPPAGPGNKVHGTLSESVIRLKVNTDHSLSAMDFFSPANAPTLDHNDTDLGSGGPVGLPASFGTAAHPHLLVEQGKDGRVFLLDRDHLGGRSQGSGGSDAVLNKIGPYQGLWGHPAAWSGNGGYVYTIGSGGPLRALKSGVTGSGLPALTMAGTSADIFPYTSGSPVITSAGSTSGTGVVWLVWANGPKGTGAQLRAYSAVPDHAGRLALLYSAPVGTAAKFEVPATDSGHVYVGTRDGRILGFGRPAKSALTGSPVDFGQVDLGASTTKMLTLTATRALTITGVSTNAPFTVNPPTLPVSLQAGEQLDLPVTFTPGAAGAATDILTVGTDSGSLGFSLNGVGTQAGLGASPPSAAFTQQATGSSSIVNVQVTNTGTGVETITSATGPAAPFTADGLPAAGYQVLPGGSFVISVTYAPSSAASDQSSITVTSTSGTLTIPVTGSATSGSGHLSIVPAVTAFGPVDVGTARTLSFDLTNTGNIPLTITKAKAPASDFTSNSPLSEGLVIGPGQVVHQEVTFQPTRPGDQKDSYEISTDTGQGAMYVPLTGTGTGAVPAPGSTWSVNGSAKLTGGDLQLTQAIKSQAGTAFYDRAVPTQGLHATFTAQLGGGTGGDGLAFALLDPATQTPASVGAKGGGVGFGGLHGIAVTLVTSKNTQAGSSNFTGVAPGPGPATGLVYAATAVVPSALRTGTHKVDVLVTGGHLKVSVDGHALLDTAAPTGSLHDKALVGFTGGTGGLEDVHTVRGVTITSAPAGGAGAPLTLAPVSVDFGTVLVGKTSTADFTLTNGGGRSETVTSITPPPAPYTATLPAVGTVIAPGASITVPVTFAPAVTGPYPDTLSVTTTSGNVIVPLNGGGSATLPDLTGSTWTYNGTASLGGGTVTLTRDGQKSAAGSVVNSTVVSPLGLHATFTAQIGGTRVTGADGLTFALLDAATAGPSALGGTGGGLGVSGLPAVFAAFDTYTNGTVTSHNFAAVGKATPGAKTVTFLKISTAIPALRKGTHLVDVTVTMSSHMIVKIDGTQVLDVAVTLPPKVLVAFTGAVGGYTDTHAVLSPSVAYLNGG